MIDILSVFFYIINVKTEIIMALILKENYYEKDFKNYDYKLENKKYKILTRKLEMEGDFNESLE